MYTITYTHTRPNTQTPFFASSTQHHTDIVGRIAQKMFHTPGFMKQTVTMSPDLLSVVITVNWCHRRDWVRFEASAAHRLLNYRRRLAEYEAATGCATFVS